MPDLIAYYRVSTDQQGQSGLGLEAQQLAVEAFARQSNARIIKRYVEVETGKRSDRPELTKAIAFAKRAKATLVVAKLDRLARNLHFTSTLMRTGVDFVACDNPHANKLTIHILAAIAEHETEQISERTKAALAAAKLRGVLLGSAHPGHWEGREHLRRAGLEKATTVAASRKRAKAVEAYADLLPLMQKLLDEGHSFREIAEEFNGKGERVHGRPWSAMQVWRVLDRAKVKQS
jgi:DNA invertase Pin-like site-specific DNA recombinase